MIELYKKADRWQEADDYAPSKGDLLLYDWDDNGQGDCTGIARSYWYCCRSVWEYDESNRGK